jgi:hypothetical protein
MTRDISPGCLETWLRDVLNQHTVEDVENLHVRAVDYDVSRYCPRYTCDVSRHRGGPNPIDVGSGLLLLAGGAGWASGALVALGCVEGELAEEFAGGGVDDADVEVLGQDDDAGSGVGSAYADGVHLALVAPGDLAGFVDLVVADAVVGVVVAVHAKGGSEAGLMAIAGWSRTEMLVRYTRARASERAAEEAWRLNLGAL